MNNIRERVIKKVFSEFVQLQGKKVLPIFMVLRLLLELQINLRLFSKIGSQRSDVTVL